jgi:hypothetical protein
MTGCAARGEALEKDVMNEEERPIGRSADIVVFPEP